MCGITAYSRAERSSIPSGLRFALAAVHSIESRGRHATGFGWLDGDQWPWYWKHAGAATQVARYADLPTSGIRTLIGHTRHATVGSPKIEANNHPVTHDGMVLVHNGRIDNDDELIELTGQARPAQVDSIALPMLLTADLGADHPTELLELVEGVASVAWLDGEDLGALHLARLAQRPIAVGWTKRGDMIMSSTAGTLRGLSRVAGVEINDITELPEGRYLRVENGEITELRDFNVRRPVRRYAEDVPTRPAKARSVALRSTEADEIDWDALVPRRGWA